MAAPAYHLRTNKAVDRHLLIELLHRWGRSHEMDEYTYYGFGGPYLEDFRLIHESFPEMEMVSIESDQDVFKRQKFHKPSGDVLLVKNDLGSFLNKFDPKDRKIIFWLDYTDLKYSNLEEFKLLLTTATDQGFIKITLRCEPKDFQNKDGDTEDKEGAFKKEFGGVWPGSSTALPREFKKFAMLLQEMLQISAEQTLPSDVGDRVFHPVSTFCYRDGSGIFTLTGMVGKKSLKTEIEDRFLKWKFSNLNWKKEPKHIDVPFLSAKERLHLQQSLPCSGKELLTVLGYKIDEGNSRKQMDQYAEFYRQYPYFIKAVI